MGSCGSRRRMVCTASPRVSWSGVVETCSRVEVASLARDPGNCSEPGSVGVPGNSFDESWSRDLGGNAASMSTLGERERLLLRMALVALEGLVGSAEPKESSSRQALVGSDRLKGLGPSLSTVIADSSELVVTLSLLPRRDLLDAARSDRL